MKYSTFEDLLNRLSDVRAARNTDTVIAVGLDNPVAIALYRNEPHSVTGPANLKWYNAQQKRLYSRISRSPSGTFKNTWVEVNSLSQALELQHWDTQKPADWSILQHVNNIDDPHHSGSISEGGKVGGPLELPENQPEGPNFAASQKYVNDKLAAVSVTRFTYVSDEPKLEHLVIHRLGTDTPIISVWVDDELVVTEVIKVDRDSVLVRFPIKEMCRVGVA